MLELAKKESELRTWIESSPVNAQWFASDPVGAIRAANLGFADDVLRELAAISSSIAAKLRQIS